MAIASYNDLLEKIPLWAERTDAATIALVPDFIFMAESDASQVLRVPAMEDDDLLDVVNGRVVIPFDFVELRALTHQGRDKVLEYLPWDQFVEINQEGGVYQDTTTPQYFSRQGTNWFISPTPADGEQILCHYYRYVPALSVTVPTNWLVTLSPQVYLYGGLAYLYEFVMDQDRAAYWRQKFVDELTKLQGIADRAEHMGSRLIVRDL